MELNVSSVVPRNLGVSVISNLFHPRSASCFVIVAHGGDVTPGLRRVVFCKAPSGITLAPPGIS